MSFNSKVASILYEIGEILAIEGDQYKSRAYNIAARRVTALTEDIRCVVDRNELEEIPGIGKSISITIKEYIETNESRVLQELQESLPKGVSEMIELEGVGPKIAMRLSQELDVVSIQTLEEAAKQHLPSRGTVLITVTDSDKAATLEITKEFQNLGFKIRTTEGTYRFLAKKGIKTDSILKMHEGRPNIVDAIKNGEIQLIINTPSGKLSKHDDSYIRKAAIKYKVPYITTTAAAAAAVKGISARRATDTQVKSLQSYHSGIK